jgi:polyhydroxyalkanoate synthesis repressor PhaR
MNAAEKSAVRLIKRYGNRKLYDVEASRYVTLEAIRALVQGGEDVRVVDNDSGEDLTRVTLAQIIYEAEKKTSGGDGTLSLPLLRRLVQFGDETVRDLKRGVERGREALESVREGVQELVSGVSGKGKGREKGKKGHSLLEELLDNPQLQRIEHSLRLLEARLGQMTRGKSAPKKRKPAKKP